MIAQWLVLWEHQQSSLVPRHYSTLECCYPSIENVGIFLIIIPHSCWATHANWIVLFILQELPDMCVHRGINTVVKIIQYLNSRENILSATSASWPPTLLLHFLHSLTINYALHISQLSKPISIDLWGWARSLYLETIPKRHSLSILWHISSL